MHPLIRMDASQKNQVLPPLLGQRVERQIDPVVNSGHVRQIGMSIRVADRNKGSVSILPIDGHYLRRGKAVDRRQYRRLHEARVRQSHEIVVAMNQVELIRMLKGRRDMEILSDLRIDAAVF